MHGTVSSCAVLRLISSNLMVLFQPDATLCNPMQQDSYLLLQRVDGFGTVSSSSTSDTVLSLLLLLLVPLLLLVLLCCPRCCCRPAPAMCCCHVFPCPPAATCTDAPWCANGGFVAALLMIVDMLWTWVAHVGILHMV
jgi:hypothetical protein